MNGYDLYEFYRNEYCGLNLAYKFKRHYMHLFSYFLKLLLLNSHTTVKKGSPSLGSVLKSLLFRSQYSATNELSKWPAFL